MPRLRIVCESGIHKRMAVTEAVPFKLGAILTDAGKRIFDHISAQIVLRSKRGKTYRGEQYQRSDETNDWHS